MAINIFHIVSDKNWGGAEQYVYDLASELRAHQCYIEIVSRNKPQILNRFRELEVPISILPLKGLTDIESALRFARLIKRGKNSDLFYVEIEHNIRLLHSRKNG